MVYSCFPLLFDANWKAIGLRKRERRGGGLSRGVHTRAVGLRCTKEGVHEVPPGLRVCGQQAVDGLERSFQ